MPHKISAAQSASITEFKRNPMAVLGDEPLAVLTHNQPAFYAVPASLYDEMIDALEDAELGRIVQERAHEVPVEVSLDEI